MRKLWVGAVVGAMVLSALVWASGGQNRHGQDGTQPRVGQKVCNGVGSQGQSQGLRMQNRAQEQRGAGEQGKRTQQRKRDGACQTSSLNSAGVKDEQLARKQIRERKKDGSCLASSQTRTRSQRRTGTC